MGVFKLPLNLCEELNQVIREFWRGGEGGRTGRERSIGLHGIKCYDLKEKGGGGGVRFQDMKAFNKALLAKQAWRLIQYQSQILPTYRGSGRGKP
jgi:hypothetical protein